MKLVKFLAFLLVLVVGASSTFLLYMMAGLQKIEDGADVAGVARTVREGFAAIFVIDVGDGKVALIDAGNNPGGKTILAELARRDLDADAVSAVFVTHGHPDHVSAIPLFKNAQVFAMKEEVDIVEGRTTSHGFVPRTMGAHNLAIKVTHPLHDDETVFIGNKQFRAFLIPGHTDGSAAYLVDGVLFLGDAADMGSDGKLRNSSRVFSDNTAVNRQSLIRLTERLSQPNVRALAPAHTAWSSSSAPLYEFAAAAKSAAQ